LAAGRGRKARFADRAGGKKKGKGHRSPRPRGRERKRKVSHIYVLKPGQAKKKGETPLHFPRKKKGNVTGDARFGREGDNNPLQFSKKKKKKGTRILYVEKDRRGRKGLRSRAILARIKVWEETCWSYFNRERKRGGKTGGVSKIFTPKKKREKSGRTKTRKKKGH